MKRKELIYEMKASGIVAIIRTSKDEHIPYIARALAEGGVKFLEVTTNTPNALKWIKTLSANEYRDIVVGAGTVLNGQMASDCIEAGAKFLVTPFTKKEIIDEAHSRDVPVLSGAMTPGEIAQAHEWGADVVKVFPAEIFGPAYIKAVKAPLDYITLMPTGGVNQQNVGEWIKAGGEILGVGSALFTAKMLDEGRYDLIAENARALVEGVAKSRR